MREYTEKGQMNGFIERSIDRTIRNYIDNPVYKEGVRNKISQTRIERGVAKGANNPRWGKHCTEKTKSKISQANWKEYSNHKTFYKAQARKVMEQKLGRKLLPTEIIHHLDHNRMNNDIDNLYLFDSHSPHLKYHKYLRDIVRGIINN